MNFNRKEAILCDLSGKEVYMERLKTIAQSKQSYCPVGKAPAGYLKGVV